MTSSQKETPVATLTPTLRWTAETMEARIVRYADLRPCFNAFIDTRSPGSEAKENFTIIGPGVSENPSQYVHIAEPHGFNIGGARQPPGCVNSQHSHDTAEVFVVHTGTWRFDLGEKGTDAQVVLHAGDVISLPTQMFRGFTNIGTESGYLFAVLGGDDPGHVLWAPAVFDMASQFGLVLMENGALIDTAAGQRVPHDGRKMPRTSAEQVAALHKPNKSDAEKLVWRAGTNSGVTPVIAPAGPLSGPHPFELAYIVMRAGDRIDLSAPELPEVLFVQSGKLMMNWDGGTVALDEGDTMTVPVGLNRHFTSDTGCVAYRVSG